MGSTDSNSIQLLIRFASPWRMVATVLLYCLGAGIVVYLGLSFDWINFWVGLSMLILLQISSQYLRVYYDTFNPLQRRALPPRWQILEEEAQTPVDLTSERGILLPTALVTLSVGAVLTVLMQMRSPLSPAAFLLLGTAFVLAFIYSVPPFKLDETGYGELIQAVLIVNLTPALAFIFQTGEFHRLIAMLTFPLLALFLALQMVLGLPGFGRDLSAGRKNLIQQTGWERGVRLHHLLIVSCYLLLGLALLSGLPWRLTWPTLLSVPFAVYQVMQMEQITTGAKPNWKLLTLNAVVTFGLVVYLMTFSLWVS